MSFNENASQLSKTRWAKTTPEERKAHAKKMSNAAWGGKSQAQKDAHAAHARGFKQPKSKKKAD